MFKFKKQKKQANQTESGVMCVQEELKENKDLLQDKCDDFI